MASGGNQKLRYVIPGCYHPYFKDSTEKKKEIFRI